MQDRLGTLQTSLRPSGPGEIAARVARLFLRFPSTAGIPAAQMERIIAAYTTDLSKLPLWAIDSAYQQVIDSGATFMPPSPEFLERVQKVLTRVRLETSDIIKILRAEVEDGPPKSSPERRDAVVAEAMRAFHAAAAVDANPPRQSRHKSRPPPPPIDYLTTPPAVSPELAAKLKPGVPA